MLEFIKNVLQNQPEDWQKLTTHRLDIYNEALAKVEFVEHFENLYANNNASRQALNELPTAFDYIRLGHPLSCIMEWVIAKNNDIPTSHVISFASNTMPLLAVLRKNLFLGKKTKVFSTKPISDFINADLLKELYDYEFEFQQLDSHASILEIESFDGSTIYVSEQEVIGRIDISQNVDFHISVYPNLGSTILVNAAQSNSTSEAYVAEIQHVRRRESIAMTPKNCHLALQQITSEINNIVSNAHELESVVSLIKDISGIQTTPLIASSGLSIQYAILMGLVHAARIQHPEKKIKFIVPPNCYGGTNDQTRRVAALRKF